MKCAPLDMRDGRNEQGRETAHKYPVSETEAFFQSRGNKSKFQFYFKGMLPENLLTMPASAMR